MYQPKPGDRVTVTRITPEGRTYRSTGTVQQISDHGHGFALTKDGGGSSWYADAATMRRNHGVEQTITPTEPEEG